MPESRDAPRHERSNLTSTRARHARLSAMYTPVSVSYARVRARHARLSAMHTRVSVSYARMQAKRARVQARRARVQARRAHVQPRRAAVSADYARRRAPRATSSRRTTGVRSSRPAPDRTDWVAVEVDSEPRSGWRQDRLRHADLRRAGSLGDEAVAAEVLDIDRDLERQRGRRRAAVEGRRRVAVGFVLHA